MFPAHAGMIPDSEWTVMRMFGVPRACGDDPDRVKNTSFTLVFPAHAGMIRQ